MEMIKRSFRFQSYTSIRLGRSNCTLLASELVSFEISKTTGYERLCKSKRVPVGSGGYLGWSKTRARTLLNKVFSFQKTGRDHVISGGVAAAKKSWREAWMPDPRRRWPVQGW